MQPWLLFAMFHLNGGIISRKAEWLIAGIQSHWLREKVSPTCDMFNVFERTKSKTQEKQVMINVFFFFISFFFPVILIYHCLFVPL